MRIGIRHTTNKAEFPAYAHLFIEEDVLLKEFTKLYLAHAFNLARGICSAMEVQCTEEYTGTTEEMLFSPQVVSQWR